jgi:hypothetical protein
MVVDLFSSFCTHSRELGNTKTNRVSTRAVRATADFMDGVARHDKPEASLHVERTSKSSTPRLTQRKKVGTLD